MIYKARSGEFLVAGKEHSWGGFRTRGEAAAFCRQVEEENAAYALRRREQSREIARRLDQEAKEFWRKRQERLAKDAALYRDSGG